MEQKFKLGDVVRLKSGGPLMTVNTLHPTEFIHTIWFKEDGSFEVGTFHEDALRGLFRHEQKNDVYIFNGEIEIERVVSDALLKIISQPIGK